jgi:hypothetical protein
LEPPCGSQVTEDRPGLVQTLAILRQQEYHETTCKTLRSYGKKLLSKQEYVWAIFFERERSQIPAPTPGVSTLVASAAA